MATYKVWLTVKDSYGNTKEIDGGNINVDLATLTPDELAQIEEALPLEDYIKRENLNTELEDYATDKELERAVETNDAIKYSDFELRPE
jgi:PKD repeat protein